MDSWRLSGGPKSAQTGPIIGDDEYIKWHSGCRHDDFQITDPLPFFFQYLDYAGKFIRSGGNMNPAAGGMVR